MSFPVKHVYMPPRLRYILRAVLGYCWIPKYRCVAYHLSSVLFWLVERPETGISASSSIIVSLYRVHLGKFDCRREPDPRISEI